MLGVGQVNDAYHRLQAFYAENALTINNAGNMVASTVNLDPKAIESNISRFAETSKVLMKGLDVLGQLHPFINSTNTSGLHLFLTPFLMLCLSCSRGFGVQRRRRT